MTPPRSVCLCLAILAAAVSGAGQTPSATPLHVIALDIQGGSVWLPVKVNGSAPLNFLLDSGAVRSVVARDTAERLGLQIVELGEQVVGSAEASVRAAASPNVRFEAGGARWTSHAGVVPMDVPSSSIGRRYDGVLGYDFLAGFVVELDFQAGRMSLYDPGTYAYSGKGQVIPMRLKDNAPYIQVRVGLPGREPTPAEMMVDSGGPGMSVFTSPFVAQHALLEAARKVVPNLLEQPGIGVGGTSRRLIGRVSFLEVGTYRLDRPLAGFSQAEIGAYSRADIAGTIGGSTLRRFKVVFDYKQGRLILEPNAQYADPPEEYNMSGLLLRARGSGWREIFVDRVQPDSPAAEAGIRAGDILVAMEGKPIDCELSEVGARLKQAGARRAVTILRDGRRQEFQLTLRRLL